MARNRGEFQSTSNFIHLCQPHFGSYFVICVEQRLVLKCVYVLLFSFFPPEKPTQAAR